MISWHDLFAALALLLVLEGILPFINPSRLRKTLELVSKMDDRQVRTLGLISMIVGLVILFLVRG